MGATVPDADAVPSNPLKLLVDCVKNFGTPVIDGLGVELAAAARVAATCAASAVEPVERVDSVRFSAEGFEDGDRAIELLGPLKPELGRWDAI